MTIKVPSGSERVMSDFGVYVHVPFCAHRCDYCAFATYADRDHLMDDYVKAVIEEIELAKANDLTIAPSVFLTVAEVPSLPGAP